MTEAEFEGLVQDMRRHQKAFYASRKAGKSQAEVNENLNRSLAAERAVDEELKRRAEARKPRAKTLFDQIDEYDQPPTERQLT